VHRSSRRPPSSRTRLLRRRFRQSICCRCSRPCRRLTRVPGNAARARTLLEAHLAARDEASRALLPYARTLLDQIIERQRLDVANVRLTQQLERSGQQLKDSQQLNEDLQRKIDALADIELGTPARPPKRSIKR
jgi:hypothetical protein